MKTRLLTLVAVFCVLASQNMNAAVLTYRPSPYKGTDVWISSYYSYNDDYGVDNDRLRVGGWGDWYYSAIKFDLEGLPQNATQAVLAMYAFDAGDGSTTVNSDVWRLTGSWDESSGMYNTSWMGVNLGSISAPTNGGYNGVIITTQYNGWKSSPSTNHGLLFAPWANNNNFNTYYSSDYSNRDYRPLIQITYDETVTPPSLKLPLPGNRSWVVTTEIGGWDAKYPGQQLYSHIDNNYFSIDFGAASSPWYSGDIPIYAAAGGKIAVVGTDPNHANGYYVVINHSNVQNETTGYTTRYLHFKYSPSVTLGQNVNQGQLLGYMGSTGASAVHLHFGVRYENSGSSSVNALSFVKMEGLPLKQYQTEVNGSGNRVSNSYFPSSNTP